METKTVKQTVTFKAQPHEVYEALMDSKKHAKFTGDKATISRKVGGKFTAYDGSLEGTNVELVPNEKIVQAWRSDDWPAGHYSKATFSLAKTESGSRLTFVQNDIPEEFFEDIKQGWHDYYWEPMKEMVAEKK